LINNSIRKIIAFSFSGTKTQSISTDKNLHKIFLDDLDKYLVLNFEENLPKISPDKKLEKITS
jgi:hypothetical protein